MLPNSAPVGLFLIIAIGALVPAWLLLRAQYNVTIAADPGQITAELDLSPGHADGGRESTPAQPADPPRTPFVDPQAVAHIGTWEYSERERGLTWSAETYRIFGVDPSRFTPTLDEVIARIHPDDRELINQCLAASLTGRANIAVDHRIMMDDGSVRYVHETGQTSRSPDGLTSHTIGTVQDITDRRSAETKMAFASTLLQIEMENSPDAILVVNDRGRVGSYNKRFAEMWGVADTLRQTDDDAPLLATVASRIKDPAAFIERVQYLYRHPEEEAQDEVETTDGRFIDRHSAALRSAERGYLGRVWFFRDVTERKGAEAEMRHLATHDTLTGLANRAVFKTSLEQTIVRARRTRRTAAVLCLDLDHFKDVNDTLGHPAGDELLCLVAARLRGSCRADDVVARFGGDEFAVIASDLGDPADAAVVASAIITALAEPFTVQGGEVRTGASIGIVTCRAEPIEAELLLSHADVALYRAKAGGRGTYRFFTESMDRDVRQQVELGAELMAAIPAGQLFLLYQPQLNATTGRVSGVEALVRWRHPTRGVLEPAAFIPVAEHSGLIGALSEWVLRASCRQAKQWLDAGLATSTIAVNLSALEFKAPLKLERDIVAVLEATGLPPNHLELEITETALMVVWREENDVLKRLRARGVRVAIDDFGTGYSSLDYLQRFSVDRIKIPQAFVAGMVRSGGAAIVRATIGLARELGIDVVAEGVETEEQRRLLTSWGCAHLQGFLFSKPLSADDLASLLSRDQSLHSVREAENLGAA